MLQLYKNIKSRRKELKMTQSELARKTGYADKSMIAKIEKGDVDLNQSKIIAFAKALDTTTRELMGLEETSNDIPPKFTDNIKQHRLVKCQTEDESNLISHYRNLSLLGQQKATTYVTNLANLENAERELSVLNAACEDSNASDEDKRASDHIMYDDSEWK